MSEIEKVWNDFWLPIIGDPPDMEQVKKELFDFKMIMGFVPRVYDYATGGKVSKPNTLPGVVKSLIDDYTDDLVGEAVKEETEALRNRLEELMVAAKELDRVTKRHFDNMDASYPPWRDYSTVIQSASRNLRAVIDKIKEE